MYRLFFFFHFDLKHVEQPPRLSVCIIMLWRDHVKGWAEESDQFTINWVPWNESRICVGSKTGNILSSGGIDKLLGGNCTNTNIKS